MRTLTPASTGRGILLATSGALQPVNRPKARPQNRITHRPFVATLYNFEPENTIPTNAALRNVASPPDDRLFVLWS
jgi:hypothetical protein